MKCLNRFSSGGKQISVVPFQETARSELVLTLHTSVFVFPNQHPAVPSSLIPPLIKSLPPAIPDP